MSVEAPRRIPWPWLMLAVGVIALARYYFDETTTETSFRVGLGLVAVGGGWIFAKSILIRPEDTTRVDRPAGAAASAGERFTLPPARFTLPPGSVGMLALVDPTGSGSSTAALGSSPGPVAPSSVVPGSVVPNSVVPAISSVPVATSAVAAVGTSSVAAVGAHAATVTYVAPAVAPHTHAAPAAASFEDPDATWMVKADDIPE